MVVFLDEGVELGLQLGECGGTRLADQPAFERLVEAFDLAAGGRMIGCGVDLDDARDGVVRLRGALRPPLPPDSRVVKTMPLSVNVEAGTP